MKSRALNNLFCLHILGMSQENNEIYSLKIKNHQLKSKNKVEELEYAPHNKIATGLENEFNKIDKN